MLSIFEVVDNKVCFSKKQSEEKNVAYSFKQQTEKCYSRENQLKKDFFCNTLVIFFR